METANIVEVTATGDVTTTTERLYAVSLTSAAAASTLEIKSGGSGGTTILLLESAANGSVAFPFGVAVPCSGGIHATISGAGASATVIHS